MASAGGGGHGFHGIDTPLSTCADRGAGRSPRNAKTLLNADRRHHHNDRPNEKAAVVVGRQSDMGGLQRAALRGPAQSGHAGRMSGPRNEALAEATSSYSEGRAAFRGPDAIPSTATLRCAYIPSRCAA